MLRTLQLFYIADGDVQTDQAVDLEDRHFNCTTFQTAMYTELGCLTCLKSVADSAPLFHMTSIVYQISSIPAIANFSLTLYLSTG